MLGCIVENYSDNLDKEQVLCEDVGLSTAPVTMLICCAVFTLAFESVPSSDPNATTYGPSNFHRFDLTLVHQVLVGLFFGTALLNCWTFASMRELADLDAYADWKDNMHWSGREARLWYNILLRCLMAVALVLPFLASTLGERAGRATAVMNFAMRVRAFGMTQKPHELGPIFRYMTVFMLTVFFSIQVRNCCFPPREPPRERRRRCMVNHSNSLCRFAPQIVLIHAGRILVRAVWR